MNNFSRTTGFQSFSPGMKQVIRHVMQVFPEGFATVSNSSQPLESSSVQPVAVMNANGMQPVEAYHYCTSESFAVIDTGCQRSAIGRRTLENISARLPDGLSIKFVSQKFRFTGIGGETVTNCVALIPVCFGQRPGMIRAAVLEDTPDAPFLLSLPILKALDATLSLGHGSMHFKAINESGMMFYNDKGQLCLKLFEFDAIAECSDNSPDQWKVQKIIGDECQVFLLQQPLPSPITGEIDNLGDKPHQSDSRDMHVDNGVVVGNYNPNPVAYDVNKHVNAAAVEPVTCTESKVSVSQFSKSVNAQTDVHQPQSLSSIAETPVSSPRPCHSDHGGTDVVSRQQTSVHLTCGGQPKVCQPVVTHVQQAQDPGSPGYHGPTHDRIGHPFDECADASTGDDDEGCGYGRGRHSSRNDEQHGDREEKMRKGHEGQLQGTSMLPEVQGSTLCKDQHHGQFLSDFCRESGSAHDSVTQTSRSIQFKPECEVSELNRSVLLRPEACSVHLSQTGSQLHETVLPMPQRTTVNASVPLLPVSSSGFRRPRARSTRESMLLHRGRDSQQALQ